MINFKVERYNLYDLINNTDKKIDSSDINKQKEMIKSYESIKNNNFDLLIAVDMDELFNPKTLLNFLYLIEKSKNILASFDYISFSFINNKLHIIDFLNNKPLDLNRNLENVYIDLKYIGSISILIEIAEIYHKETQTVYMNLKGLITYNFEKFFLINNNLLQNLWKKISKSKLILIDENDNMTYDFNFF